MMSAPPPTNSLPASDGVTLSSGKPVVVGEVSIAGLQPLNHSATEETDKRTLPKWRYNLRQILLPLIRWETPQLARIQRFVRTPFLDSYFAITANLGTHTFFMIFLPAQFWCGYAGFGKSLVRMLSGGVFFTSMVKDFFSLPRPLSPPLHRISMSRSTSLEYGFPSTHSANAISVVLYSILVLRSPDNTMEPKTKVLLELVAHLYWVTIVFGRMYCGMHGFLDVIVGSVIGTALAYASFFWGPMLDEYMHASTWMAPFIAGLICLVLVAIHPEPADDCPCFDDSVAVAGVVIGVETGTWSFGRVSMDPWTGSLHSSVPPPISLLSWSVVVIRLALGVAVVFVWREVAKPTLLRVLPHIFRFLSHLGLTRARRFFVQADDYTAVPEPRDTRIDNVIPSAEALGKAIESMRDPKARGRSVSVGPQSAADAYETLSFREKQRQEGVDRTSSSRRGEIGKEKQAKASGVDAMDSSATENLRDASKDQEVFAKLTRPRVRYDVEIVTKLVVYAGIGLLATQGIPIIFEMTGLGTNHLR